MKSISLTCPKCKSRFSAPKKVVPLADKVDIDTLLYTCPHCYYKFMKNPKSKYQSVECYVGGIKFQSRLEGRRYAQLMAMEQAGEISDLSLQPVFLIQEAVTDLHTNEKLKPIHYRGDFMYTDSAGQKVCEEVKGFFTDLAKLKLKLVIPRYPDVRFVVLFGKDF